MSLVDDGYNSIQLNVIPSRIALYEQLIEASEETFKLEGKGLEELNRNHAASLINYNYSLQECKTIEESVKLRLEEIEAQVYKKYNEAYQKALSTTDIKQYIKGDPQYVTAYKIYLEVNHVRRQLEAIVEALIGMGWSLSNIVKLRIAEMEHVVL